MTCVPQVDEEPVKKEEEKKKELKPWEIDTLPDDPDLDEPPDKEWEVTVKWLTVRSQNFVKAPDAYWAVERVFHDDGGYDYDEFGGEMGEVCNVVEERPRSPPP